MTPLARVLRPDETEAGLPPLLGAELADVLEREITELRLAPGSKLVVDAIAERFGLSRSPVREALQTLAGMGLVEHAPRRGMFVTPLSVERLDEIYACRKPLEALAAAGAARNATPALRKALGKLLDRMDAARAKSRPDAAFKANVAFTDLLHAHCGNAYLQRLLATLDKQALRYRFCCYVGPSQMIAADIAANHALAEAINASDPERAAALTERLIDASWDLVRSAVLTRTDLGLAPQDGPGPKRHHTTTVPDMTRRKNG